MYVKRPPVMMYSQSEEVVDGSYSARRLCGADGPSEIFEEIRYES